MSFNAYKSFTGPIQLPIGDKTYTLPTVTAPTGVKVMLIMEHTQEVIRISKANADAADEAAKNGEAAPEPEPLPELDVDGFDDPMDLTRELLGPLYDEMIADGVPYASLVLAGQTAAQDFLFGREAAETYWNSNGDPKALAAALPAANAFSKSTGAENTTPTPDSTSGTKPQKSKSKS